MNRQFEIFIKAMFSAEKRDELFKSIWNEYHKRIAVFAKMMTGYGRDDCRDIAQDIMLKVFKNLHTYNPLYSFQTWIFQIARNHCLDQLKKPKPPQGRFDNQDEDLELSDALRTKAPDEITEARELLTLVETYVRRLDDKDRQIAYLAFYENLPYGKISRIIGVPVGTIKYKVHTIRAGLKNYVEQQNEIKQA